MEYSIKQISDKMHLTAHTLRYYEKEGLLPDVKRTENGIRRFSDEDVEWLGLVCCLKNTGMSIHQIRAFVALSQLGDGTLKQRVDILLQQKHNVEQQIAELHKHLTKVSHKIEHYTRQYEAYLDRRIDDANQTL